MTALRCPERPREMTVWAPSGRCGEGARGINPGQPDDRRMARMRGRAGAALSRCSSRRSSKTGGTGGAAEPAYPLGLLVLNVRKEFMRSHREAPGDLCGERLFWIMSR